MLRIPILILLCGWAAGARAQSAPFLWNAVVGVTPAQVLPSDVGPRPALSFRNTAATATIAICPATDRSGKPITCALHGAGSVTLHPFDTFQLRAIDNREYFWLPWNAASDQANASLTIIEAAIIPKLPAP